MRLLLTGLVLLFAVVAIVWWAGRGSDRAAVTLAFIGYTNLHGLSLGTGTLSRAPHISMALLLVTNRGEVPVKLFSAVNPKYLAPNLPATGVVWQVHESFALPVGPSVVLKPHESTVTQIHVNPEQGPWWTEISYQRHGWRERFYGWLWNSGNSRAWLNRIMSAPDLVPVAFTNRTPSGGVSF